MLGAEVETSGAKSSGGKLSCTEMFIIKSSGAGIMCAMMAWTEVTVAANSIKIYFVIRPHTDSIFEGLPSPSLRKRVRFSHLSFFDNKPSYET